MLVVFGEHDLFDVELMLEQGIVAGSDYLQPSLESVAVEIHEESA